MLSQTNAEYSPECLECERAEVYMQEMLGGSLPEYIQRQTCLHLDANQGACS